MTVIGHASDLHGDYDVLINNTRKPDLWVFSGDMLATEAQSMELVQSWKERSFQAFTFKYDAPHLKTALMDVPVLVVDGNHDFLSFATLLQEAGVEAYPLTVRPEVVFHGLRFSGYPHIPWIQGYWNHERRLLRPYVEDIFADPPDVLVTHMPPLGILDATVSGGHSAHYGCQVLADALLPTLSRNPEQWFQFSPLTPE